MLRARVLTAMLILGVPAAALAHNPGLSSLEVRVARGHVEVDLSLAGQDAGHAARHDHFVGFDTFALRAIELQIDGRPLRGTAAGVSVDTTRGVRIRLTFETLEGDQLIVRSAVPRLLARGHRQLLSIRASDGTLLAEQMLDAGGGEGAVDLRAVSTVADSAASFFRLGIEHILGGYDHLLFLAGLLVVVERRHDLIATITAFTAAHSLTLAVAVLGLMNLSPAIVEPLIAASIVYVGVENLVGARTVARWQLSFAFGLIHGFGFAGALRELGIGVNDSAVALPLLSFNFGVEAGQVAVAMALMPIVWRLRAHSAIGARLARACSLLILVAGSYWLVERTLSIVLLTEPAAR